MQKQQSFDVKECPNSSAVLKMLQEGNTGKEVSLVNIDWSTATATFDVAEKKAAEKK